MLEEDIQLLFFSRYLEPNEDDSFDENLNWYSVSL
jgi:hypothetical protein